MRKGPSPRRAPGALVRSVVENADGERRLRGSTSPSASFSQATRGEGSLPSYSTHSGKGMRKENDESFPAPGCTFYAHATT